MTDNNEGADAPIALRGVKDTIWINTTAYVDQDKGKRLEIKYRTKWKKLPVSEAAEVLASSRNNEIGDRGIFDEYLLKIDGLTGAGGEPLELSPELLDAMCEAREYKESLSNAFLEAQTGRKRALEGN